MLWFVHGDAQVAPSSLADIALALSEGCVGGFFRLHFYDADDRFMRFVERTSHTQARRFGLIFGDQALFLRRDVFDSLGGFAPLALMEDWELARRLRPLHRKELMAISRYLKIPWYFTAVYPFLLISGMNFALPSGCLPFSLQYSS